MAAQLALEDLAGGVLRQGFAQQDASGDLVAAQVLPAPVLQLTGVGGRAGLGDDEGDRDLAMERMRLANYCRLRDRRVAIEDLFNHPGVNIHSVGDDEILDPIHQKEVAIAVPVPQIPSAEPVTEEGGPRLLREPPVPLHDVRAADTHLAMLTVGERPPVGCCDPHLHARDGEAHGARLAGTDQRVDGGHRGALGRAVALQNRHGEALLERGHHCLRHGGPAGDTKADRAPLGDSVLVEAQQQAVHAGDAEEDGRLMSTDGRGHQPRLEPLDRNQGQPVEQRRQQADGGGKGVEHGQHHQDAVPTRDQAQCLGDAGRIGREIAVAQHGALGTPGGTGGVKDRGEVLGGIDRQQRDRAARLREILQCGFGPRRCTPNAYRDP